jgi:CubicO group peptidase (beta-lactamase class C family)
MIPKRDTPSRMKFLLMCWALLLFPVVVVSDTDLTGKLDAYLNSQVSASGFSGAILVARSGKILLVKGYGLANIELNVKNESKSKFRLGSMTQQFTAMAILELQEQKKLNIQDSVCKYIQNCPNDWQAIQIVNLLTHTSGISSFTEFPDYENTSTQPTSVPELLAHFRSKPTEFKPGEKFKYSNSGYQVLGAVIENVSGTSYANYLAERIFAPLEMRDTGYDDPARILSGRASGYRKNGGSHDPLNATYLDMSIPFSAGGLYSTVEDLYRWDGALYTEKLISNQSLNQMFTPYRDGYGFGWKILRELERRVAMWGSRINGFSASIRRYPDDNACVIVLSNFENTDAEKISHDLGGILFDVHYGQPMDRHATQ